MPKLLFKSPRTRTRTNIDELSVSALIDGDSGRVYPVIALVCVEPYFAVVNVFYFRAGGQAKCNHFKLCS